MLNVNFCFVFFFFFQAEDGIRDGHVTGVQTCALPISVELCRSGRKLESALRSNVGQIALRLALVDVLAVQVEAETEIVSAPRPAQVGGVIVRGITVAMRLKVISGSELGKAVDQHERPA